MSNCIDCPYHKKMSDPDPYDWFCDDDIAIVCTQTPNPDKKTGSKYRSDRSPYRPVTTSCRPYNARKESKTPEWCPIIVVDNQKDLSHQTQQEGHEDSAKNL